MSLSVGRTGFHQSIPEFEDIDLNQYNFRNENHQSTVPAIRITENIYKTNQYISPMRDQHQRDENQLEYQNNLDALEIKWQSRYQSLLDQSREEVIRLGQQFKKDSLEIEKLYNIRLMQIEDAKDRTEVFKSSNEKQSNRQHDVVNHYSNFDLKKQNDYEKTISELRLQLELSKLNSGYLLQESQIQVDNNLLINQLQAKDQDRMKNLSELDQVCQQVQSDNQRLNHLVQQMVVELQSVNDKNTDLRIIDDFQLNERDQELTKLKGLVFDYKTRIEDKEAEAITSESKFKKESDRLKQLLKDQNLESEQLKHKITTLEQIRIAEQDSLTVLVVSHENELNLWRSRQLQSEGENGRLTAQIQNLLEEMDTVCQYFQDIDQDKNENLQKELINTRQQFNLLTKNYKRVQSERSLKETNMTRQINQQQEISAIQEELQSIISQQKKEIQNLNNQKQQLKENQLAKEVENENLKLQIVLQSSGLQDQKAKAQKDKDTYIYQQQQFQNIQEALRDSNNQKLLLQERIQLIQQNSQHMEDKLRQQEGLDQNNFEIKLNELFKLIQQLEFQLVQVQTERDKLYKDHQNLQREQERFEEQTFYLEELKSQLADQRREMIVNSEKQFKLNGEFNHLKEKLQERTNDMDNNVYVRTKELSNELQQKKNECEDLKVALQQTKNEIYQIQLTAKTQGGYNEGEIQKMMREISALEQTNAKLIQQIKIVENEKENMKQKLSIQEKQNLLQTQDAQQEIQKNISNFDHLTSKYEMLQQDNNRLRTELQNLGVFVNDSKNIQSQQKRDSENSSKDLNQLRSDNQQLSMELTNRGQQIHNLQLKEGQLTIELTHIKEQRLREQQMFKEQLDSQKHNQQQTLEQQRYLNQDHVKQLEQSRDLRLSEFEHKSISQRDVIQKNHALELAQHKLQISSLDDNLQWKDKEIMELLEQIQQLQKQHRDKQNQVYELDSQLDKVRIESKRTQSQLLFTEEEMMTLTLRLEHVTSEVRVTNEEQSYQQQVNEELMKLKFSHAQLQNEYLQLQERYEKVNNSELKQKLIQEQQNNEEKYRMESSISYLNQQITLLTQQIEYLTSEKIKSNSDYVRKISELEGDMEILIEDSLIQHKAKQLSNQQIIDLQDQLNQAQNQISQLLSNQTQAKQISSQQIKDFQDTLNQAQQNQTQAKQLSNQQIKDLQESLNQAQNQISQLQQNQTSAKQLSISNQQIKDLQESLNQAQNQISQLQQAQRLSYKSNETTEKMKNDIQMAWDENYELATLIKTKDSNIDQLNEELNKQKKNLQDLQTKVLRYEKIIQELETALGESNKKEDDLNSKIYEMQKSERQLTGQRDSLQVSSQNKDLLSVKVIQLEKELQQAREREKELNQKIQRSQEYEQAYRDSVRSNQDSIKQGQINDGNTNTIKQLKSQILDQEEEIDILIDRVKQQDQEIKGFLVQFNLINKQNQDYQQEVSFMKELVNDSSSKIKTKDNNSDEIIELKRRIIELENRCALLALDNAGQKKKLETVRKSMTINDNQGLLTEVDEWRSRAQQLDRELNTSQKIDTRYWRDDNSQILTVSTRQQLGITNPLGISAIKANK